MLQCTPKWRNSLRELKKASQVIGKIGNYMLRGKAALLCYLFIRALNGEEIGKKFHWKQLFFSILKTPPSCTVMFLSLFFIIRGFMLSGRYLIRKYNLFFSSVSKLFLLSVCAGCKCKYCGFGEDKLLSSGVGME